eukprot:CAMPEP_0204378750 /NCGR_PEP_ID=MMETSP0469-20131031/52044_1 /ASSEMBLY_ACC=CAM_ASM_000384 /TAXON_ID=2969 /ORGANISM="Oxyrrhis marina" /LENGTH=49 /DNA_ID= /DNA_START= /DNA_END= /DNA_ORIENTATION=
MGIDGVPGWESSCGWYLCNRALSETYVGILCEADSHSFPHRVSVMLKFE